MRNIKKRKRKRTVRGGTQERALRAGVSRIAEKYFSARNAWGGKKLGREPRKKN